MILKGVTTIKVLRAQIEQFYADFVKSPVSYTCDAHIPQIRGYKGMGMGCSNMNKLTPKRSKYEVLLAFEVKLFFDVIWTKQLPYPMTKS
jgi:hypothetical protein